MAQSGNGPAGALTSASLKTLLCERIAKVDIAAACEEVRPFLRDARELELWSQEFFLQLTEKITVEW